MTRIIEPGTRLSESDIERFEKELGQRLPQSYRDFLIEHDGGRPQPSSFVLARGSSRSAWDVKVFYGIHRKIESSRLGWAIEVTKETRSRDKIPIGSDDFGNMFYLQISGSQRGAVFLGMMPPTPFQKSEMIKIASDFSDFLDHLKEYEEVLKTLAS